MNVQFFSKSAPKRFLLIISILMIGVVFPSHTAKADYYLTFMDGRLYVFPSKCYKKFSKGVEEITFIANDDVVYSYLLSDIKSIDHQLPKELPIFTSYKFSNKYNYQVFTDAVGTISDDRVSVKVAGIGKRLTASFALSDENARAYVDCKEQESKVSRLRFENNRTYVVGYPGDLILTEIDAGKYAMMPFGNTYSVNVYFLTDYSTSVPRIDINTEGGVNISSKDYYVNAEIIINGARVFPSMTDSVQIKGRGNDSWSSNPNSKNPYRLKFANKVKPFGLSKGKNWVLLSNKRPGSLLTNAFGMKAASLVGTVAPNHIIPVDLYINGKYKGSYNFTEKVGLAGNSVDLNDETKAALLELDTYFDEPETQKFRSTSYNTPVNVKDPEFGEDETLLTIALIQDRYNSFEAAMRGDGDIADHVDIDALARFLLANDLVLNREIFHPKSTFCYNENILNDSSKFIFGPVWDLDWAYGFDGLHASTFFDRNITLDFFTVSNEFFNDLFKDNRVKYSIYKLCQEFLADGLDELCEYCQDYYDYAAPSITRNGDFGLDATDYGKQVEKAQNWFTQRANLIYEQLKNEIVLPGDVNGNGVVSITDITVLIDYMLSGSHIFIIKDNADVDGNGEITINDVTTLIDQMLSIE